MEREQSRTPTTSANLAAPAATYPLLHSRQGLKDKIKRKAEAPIPLLNGQRGSQGFKGKQHKLME